MSPAPLGAGGLDLSLPAFKVRAFFPFQLNELPNKKKTIRVETSALPARKELSINEIIHTGGGKKKTKHILFCSAEGCRAVNASGRSWRLRRGLEAGEARGRSAFLLDHSLGTSIITGTMG